LSRLGLFCVLHHVSSRYSAANGPKLDPSFQLDGRVRVPSSNRYLGILRLRWRAGTRTL
jgi:hypothetical protein